MDKMTMGPMGMQDCGFQALCRMVQGARETIGDEEGDRTEGCKMGKVNKLNETKPQINP